MLVELIATPTPRLFSSSSDCETQSMSFGLTPRCHSVAAAFALS